MWVLGKSTAYIERSQLTSRLFNGHQVRKTLAFSKDITAYQASSVWEDSYYNLVCTHKSLRLPVQDSMPQMVNSNAYYGCETDRSDLDC